MKLRNMKTFMVYSQTMSMKIQKTIIQQRKSVNSYVMIADTEANKKVSPIVT